LYYATNNFSVTRQGKEIIFKKHRSYGVGIFLALFVFAFFSGVRWDVGIDHLTYVDFYQTIARWGDGTIRGDLEEGYVLLMKIFNLFGFHYSIFMAFIAFCQLGFIYYAFKDVKYIIPFLGVCIMCGGDFFCWMNVVRQSLVATCFVFLLTHFLVYKKFIPYLICLIIASFIHKTALMLLVLYPLTYLNLETIYINRKIQYLLLIVVWILSMQNVWINILDIVDKVLVFSSYDRYSAEFVEEAIKEKNIGGRTILFIVIHIIIIFFSKRLRKENPTKIYGICYLMFLVFMIIEPLLMHSRAFSRITTYFMVFRSIISSYFMFYCYKINKKYKLVGLFVLCLFILYILSSIYLDKGGHTDCIRYHFIWENHKFVS
jgi:hypothetical protein